MDGRQRGRRASGRSPTGSATRRSIPPAWAEELGDWLIEQVTTERETAIALYRLQVELLGTEPALAVHREWGQRLREVGTHALEPLATATPELDVRIVVATLDGLRMSLLNSGDTDVEWLRLAVRRQLQALLGCTSEHRRRPSGRLHKAVGRLALVVARVPVVGGDAAEEAAVRSVVGHLVVDAVVPERVDGHGPVGPGPLAARLEDGAGGLRFRYRPGGLAHDRGKDFKSVRVTTTFWLPPYALARRTSGPGIIIEELRKLEDPSTW